MRCLSRIFRGRPTSSRILRPRRVALDSYINRDANLNSNMACGSSRPILWILTRRIPHRLGSLRINCLACGSSQSFLGISGCRGQCRRLCLSGKHFVGPRIHCACSDRSCWRGCRFGLILARLLKIIIIGHTGLGNRSVLLLFVGDALNSELICVRLRVLCLA